MTADELKETTRIGQDVPCKRCGVDAKNPVLDCHPFHPDGDFSVYCSDRCLDFKRIKEEDIPKEIERRRLYEKLPWFLSKACEDCWAYAIETTNGQQFVFDSAEPTVDGWIRLTSTNHGDYVSLECFGVKLNSGVQFVKGRGIEIRIDSIVWISDMDS